MDYKGHLKTTSIFGIIALDKLSGGDFSNLSHLGLLGIGALGFGAIIGSGLPDIDHHNSLAAKKLRLIGWLVSRAFSHRGFTHSIAFSIVVYVLFMFGEPLVPEPYLQAYRCLAFSTVFGVLAHIAMDMFVGNGVRLFSPISQKKISFLKIRSGSRSEAGFHKFIVFCFFVYLIVRSEIGSELVELVMGLL